MSLRHRCWRLAEKARAAHGQPTPSDIAEVRQLFKSRMEAPTNALSLIRELRLRPEPDWSTWASIEEFCNAYHAALKQINDALAVPLAEERLRGI